MTRSTKVTKAERKQAYFAEIESRIVAARPDLAGKINWPTLYHFHFTSLQIKEAVRRYLAARPY